MTPDPAVTRMVAAALALLLVVGATQKLRDIATFRHALESYALVPSALLTLTAWTLPLCEGVAGLALVIDRAHSAGAVLGLALLGVVTLAVAINLARGRTDLGCGCGGIEDEQTLSWGLVLRNLVLVGLLVLTLAEPAPRVLTWLDYVTVGIGATCLYGLYVLVNQLLANQPRLWRLRSSS